MYLMKPLCGVYHATYPINLKLIDVIQTFVYSLSQQYKRFHLIFLIVCNPSLIQDQLLWQQNINSLE